MHTCSPPKGEFKNKFTKYAKVSGNFGHTLLEQKSADDGSLAANLKEYFESAHLDAREKFHDNIGIDLHPYAQGGKPLLTYPASLPSKSRRGLFGEVMAGLLTETYKYVGNHNWCVPIFLFSYHQDAWHYLSDLVQNPNKRREVIGRFGSDFIGLLLNNDGSVSRIISGEAKWRATLTPGGVDTLMLGEWIDQDPSQPKSSTNRQRSGKGVWGRVNGEVQLPVGVRQLQMLLKDNNPKAFDATILSLQTALISKNSTPLPKTNLIVVVGNGGSTRVAGSCLLPSQNKPPEYTAGNDLQIVEVIMTKGEVLIDTIYDSLWKEDDDA